MDVRPATAAHRAAWIDLRQQLWPQESVEGHAAEIDDALARSDTFTAFVAVDQAGALMGFIEAAVRFDHVNGCEGSPVAFLEGIYVAPAFRKQGVARALIAAFEDWAKGKDLREMASDAEIDNRVSHAMHQALGFAETKRVVYFRKPVA
ncbi:MULTISPECIES: aminoglycoside 6'-N-acetyltransferase [Alphaproteobacteria]|uniref:Aminoglycoside N(6')-acetyltransferase type 1 n=2 Tax=Alphaproteobacteria TaxID=28211 RepID=A0A512HEZ3_9HYPH|nr:MULTISPECIES: aminoglycoside 6'-N-acetyltransferase [Alphaproteobacteria]GEO84023.1 aminoglycoside N(6')-acetyltransferase type 1 [Ciceribacter naphthalenivorans]GLR21099.1 aminoglycoside N(6')-acetyltransferase type 1 [Ciceribacter naphthalenivorans]GLT03955.1 aminoglycoside N(6')-acetyltransferase type 1 [Sphingomonas psychrolutea]